MAVLHDTLRPNAAGDAVAPAVWETQFPNSDFHWDKVDEAVADDDATYISTQFNGRTELFNLPSMSALGSYGISEVKVYIRAKKTATGSNVFAYPVIKTGGTVYQGGGSGLSTSWGTQSRSWLTNPQTGVRWTEADINALQVGVLSNGGWLEYVTQIYVEIYVGSFVYPSDSVARVSTIRHIYKPGFYRMQVSVGDMGFDADIVEARVKKELEDITASPEETPKPVTPESPKPTIPVTPASVSPNALADTTGNEGSILTRYSQDILDTPAGKAAVARQQTDQFGVQAAVTPYSIDVLRKKAEAAKVLIEIQRLTAAASVVSQGQAGMTGYAREVLLKRIAQLKEQLSKIYSGGQ